MEPKLAEAENWAHDNLTEGEYEDSAIRDLAVRAFTAGFEESEISGVMECANCDAMADQIASMTEDIIDYRSEIKHRV